MEAFRDRAGGDGCRAPTAEGKGAKEGGGGLVGDMADEEVMVMATALHVLYWIDPSALH